MRKLALLIILFVFFVPTFLQAQESAAKPPWDPLKFFVGDWEGTFQGEPGHGKGERHYEFVLRGKFLRATNRSVCPQQEKNPKGEVHEDLGFYSYDDKRRKFMLRQFHVEGFVNEYVEQEISPDGKTLRFITERIENIPDGWRGRETYKIVNQDEYTEVFEMAPPQKDFAPYSESHWKRVK